MQEIRRMFQTIKERQFWRSFQEQQQKKTSTLFQKEIDQCMKGITLCGFHGIRKQDSATLDVNSRPVSHVPPLSLSPQKGLDT